MLLNKRLSFTHSPVRPIKNYSRVLKLASTKQPGESLRQSRPCRLLRRCAVHAGYVADSGGCSVIVEVPGGPPCVIGYSLID